jgi:outer membrane protein assembly factor BamE
MPVQQGNFLDPSQVVQLQAGMTRSQVKFLLGTPMVPSGFDSDRWDYYYYDLGTRMKEPITKRLTVYFKDDKVERFDRPADTEEAAARMAGASATAPKP